MKKFSLLSIALLLFGSMAFSQAYFQATMRNNGNRLTFYLRPTGGDIPAMRFSAIELFVRTAATAPAFTFGTVTAEGPVTGANFIQRPPNTYGAEEGYNNFVFEWIAGANFLPATPTTFPNGVEFPIFSVDVNGASPSGLSIALIHNDLNGNFAYVNVSSSTGDSKGCVDNFGNTIGDAFYGPGFYKDASTSGGTNHLLPLASVPLPIRFLSFTAVKNNNTAQLNWTVANESTQANRYEVQRSLNGTDFVTVATINVNGTANAYYLQTDANIDALRVSTVYYRIKQLDNDGRFVYSEVRTLSLAKGNVFQVYPNPVQSAATLSMDLTDKAALSITMFDAAGKAVMQKNISAISGQSRETINMQNLPKGKYTLHIVVNGTASKDIQVIKGDQ